MAIQHYRTVLVIGDNPDEIIKKYSGDTKVEKHLVAKRSDASIKKENHLRVLNDTIKNKVLDEKQTELMTEYISLLNEMTDLEYFLDITQGCEYDEQTGDAYSYVNPNAYYKNERSPQKIFEINGEETGFCNPFKLFDDYISYSATKGEIDWKKNHLHNQEVYKAAWELVVDNREPKNEKEKIIKYNMKNRHTYFNNFKDKEEYVSHSTAFWAYGIATETSYKEIGMDGVNDKEWIKTFYDKFIKELPDDTLLTIYEVQSLD